MAPVYSDRQAVSFQRQIYLQLALVSEALLGWARRHSWPVRLTCADISLGAVVIPVFDAYRAVVLLPVLVAYFVAGEYRRQRRRGFINWCGQCDRGKPVEYRRNYAFSRNILPGTSVQTQDVAIRAREYAKTG